MATPVTSLNEAPTNGEIFKRILVTFLIVTLNMADIRLTSERYIHLFPNTGSMMQPPFPSRHISLYDCTFTEAVFLGSYMVNLASLLVITGTAIELTWNWRDDDESKRPINMFYRIWMRIIFVDTTLMLLVRWIVILSADEGLVWMLVVSLILMVLAILGCMIWLFLRSIKRSVK